jgi:quercetin 2,3-dioxygenase
MMLHQAVDVFVGRLDRNAQTVPKLRPGCHAWVQVIGGELDLNGTALETGDGAAASDENELRIRTTATSHFLLFDLS